MQHVDIGGALQFTDKPQNTRGGNSTAVSLGNNAAMPVLFAGLLEKTNSWMECLLADGALLPHPVCDEPRPLPATDDSQLQHRQFWGRIFETGSEDAELVAGADGTYPLTRNLGVLPSTMPRWPGKLLQRMCSYGYACIVLTVLPPCFVHVPSRCVLFLLHSPQIC